MQDPLICTLRLEVENGTRTDYSVWKDGALMVETSLYVPRDEALKREILEEAHCSAFAMHPKRQKPSGLLQPLSIPKWKCEHITTDFVFKLPRIRNNHDGVWVIMDRLTKTIQTLENMLRACALQFQGDWHDKLPLMEFAYNNSYQSSIWMSPYDALYGR
ncbi:unnamed protein product [Prunus brigantina]